MTKIQLSNVNPTHTDMEVLSTQTSPPHTYVHVCYMYVPTYVCTYVHTYVCIHNLHKFQFCQSPQNMWVDVRELTVVSQLPGRSRQVKHTQLQIHTFSTNSQFEQFPVNLKIIFSNCSDVIVVQIPENTRQ